MQVALIGIHVLALLAYSVESEEITHAINEVRFEHKLQPVAHERALVEWARLNNNAQQFTGVCGHYVHGPYGQVAACVYGVPHSARKLVSIWMESPEHAAEILRPDSRFGGGAVAIDGNRQWWTYNLYRKRVYYPPNHEQLNHGSGVHRWISRRPTR